MTEKLIVRAASAASKVTSTSQSFSSAFQEGQDAALMGQALNPYRRASKALIGVEGAWKGRLVLDNLASEWDDGFCSIKG